jgi:hypothetical protein
LVFEITCSPVLGGNSLGEVKQKLNDWAELNCPEKVAVEEPASSWKGCYVQASRPNSRISTDVNQLTFPSEDCVAQSGTMYGAVQCH